MKTKRFLLAAFVALCATAATTVFTACGDDDNTITIQKSYMYQIVSVYGLNVDQTEDGQVKADLNQALGNTAVIKVYGDNVDEEMKTRCRAVIEKYSNVKTFYLALALQRKSNLDFDYQTIDTYVIGYCKTGSYVSMTYDDRHPIYGSANHLRDSLYSLKTAADSAYYKTLVNISNKNINTVQAALATHLKDYVKILMPESDLNDVNRICDSIFKAHANDTLITDFPVTYYVDKYYPVKEQIVYRRDTLRATIK